LTRKRRRKRSGQNVGLASSGGPAEPTTSEDREEKAPAREAERPQRWGARPSPYPPLGVTLARGLRTVGGSWPTLATVFVAALVTWLAFAAVGEESNPRFMVSELAVPPANIFLTDISTMFSFGGSAVGTLGVMVGLAVLRAATFGAILLMIDRRARTPDATLGETFRRFPKLFVTLVAVYIIEVTVAVIVQQVAVGLIGPQFFLLGVIATLYFLAMVPVVAAAEDASAQESLRRGFRATRLPGTRHLGLVMAYAILMLTLLLLMPGAVLAPATPTVTTWLLVLLASFVHSSVLAGLHYRWLVVRDEVPAAARRAPARPARGGRSS
jgi:hypothetical protein